MSGTVLKRQPVLYPDAPAGSLAAKRPDVDNGNGAINTDRYYSKDVLRAEWDLIWTRTWHLAGAMCDLKSPGDFFTYDFMHEHFLIVMQNDRKVKAFYNVCPHRGNRLVYADHGSIAAFSCIYHGWKFALGGNLLSVRDPESFSSLNLSRVCLGSLRCEIYGGLVWINMDENAPPAKESLGLPDGLLESYRLEEMVTVNVQTQESPGNWKLALENAMEAYHFDVVHPAFPEIINPLAIQYDLHDNGASSWFVPFGAPSALVDQVEVNDSLKAFMANAGIDPDTFAGTAQDVRAAVQRMKRQHAVAAGFDISNFIDGQFTDGWAVNVFPGAGIALNFEAVMFTRFIPHETDPGRYWRTSNTLFRPGSTFGKALPPYMGAGLDLNPRSIPTMKRYSIEDGQHLGPLVEQDVDIIAKTYVGLRSRGYEAPIWGEQEQRLRHFHKEYDRYMNREK